MHHFCTSLLCGISICDIICDISAIICNISIIGLPNLAYRQDVSLLVHAQFVAYEFRVTRYANDKVGMLIVSLNDRIRRFVPSQFLMDGGEAGSSALRQMQFFKELAQTRIAIATGMNTFGSSQEWRDAGIV